MTGATSPRREPAEAGPPPLTDGAGEATARGAPAIEGRAANPYPGPRPFQEDDGGRFFGREPEVAAIGYRILANPIYLIYASSGAGKSSLVRAGLCPWLRGHGAVARVVPSLRQAAATWPAGRPAATEGTLAALASRAIREGHAAGGEDGHEDAWRGARVRVLFFDQLEEVFELDPARWRERQGFFEELAAACRPAAPAAPVDPPELHVVLVVREEYLARLTSYARYLPGSLDARYHLEPLRAEGALEAIRRPARQAGYAWSDAAARWLLERLSQAGEASPDGAAEFVDTTLLQVVCRDLWGRARAANLRESSALAWLQQRDARQGVFERSLAEYYLEQLGVAAAARLRARGRTADDGPDKLEMERGIADWIEGALIRGERRNPFVWAADTGAAVEEKVIDALEAGHLIQTYQHRQGQRILELSHDRLVPVIRQENERLRDAAEDYGLPPAPDEQSIVRFVDRTAYSVARAMRLGRVHRDDLQARLALPDDDWTSHAVAEAHFCLGVLQGHVSFGRLLPASFPHLEGTLLDDVRRLRAYLIWERRRNDGHDVENYYTACERLRAAATSVPPLGERDAAKVKSYLRATYLGSDGRLCEGNPRCRAVLQMKAAQLWDVTGRRRRDEENWFDARRQLALFYENVLGAVERDDPHSLASLRRAASGELARGVDCLQAAIALFLLRPGSIHEYHLV